MNSKLLEKLAKLIRLTASPNVHEAELAMAKAVEIATLNNINLASVQADCEKSPEEIFKDTVDCGQRMSVSQKFVNIILGRYFEVKLVVGGSRYGGRKIHFVGEREKIDFAVWVNTYLNEVFMQSWHSYKKTREVSANIRETYFLGLFRGFCQKMDEAKREAEKAIAPEAEGSYQLVVADKKRALEIATNGFFPHLRKSPKMNIGMRDRQAYDSGFQKGKTINLHKQIA